MLLLYNDQHYIVVVARYSVFIYSIPNFAVITT